MPKIEWDKNGQRFYETGVKNGVLYTKTTTGSGDSATTTWKGVAWNGLTAVTESPSGAEATPLYADDIKYLNLISNEEFGCTIEAYTYPDEFAACDGSASLANGVMIGQQKRSTFGLCYRTTIGNDEGLEAYKLHIVYNCLAAPSEKAYATINDSPEAITFSWEVTTTPEKINGYKPTACITIDSTKADGDKLAELEGMLYGTDAEGGAGTDPYLPTPDQIAALFGTAG